MKKEEYYTPVLINVKNRIGYDIQPKVISVFSHDLDEIVLQSDWNMEKMCNLVKTVVATGQFRVFFREINFTKIFVKLISRKNVLFCTIFQLLCHTLWCVLFFHGKLNICVICVAVNVVNNRNNTYRYQCVCDPGKNDSNPRHQTTWLSTFVYHDKNFHSSLKGLMDKRILYK